MTLNTIDNNIAAAPSTFFLPKTSVVVNIEKIQEVGLRYFVLALYIFANIMLISSIYWIDLWANGSKSEVSAATAPSTTTARVATTFPAIAQTSESLLPMAKNIAAVLAKENKTQLTDAQKEEILADLKVGLATYPSVQNIQRRSHLAAEQLINATAEFLLDAIDTEHSRILAEEASQPSTLSKVIYVAKQGYRAMTDAIGFFKTAFFLYSAASAASAALDTYLSSYVEET